MATERVRSHNVFHAGCSAENDGKQQSHIAGASVNSRCPLRADNAHDLQKELQHLMRDFAHLGSWNVIPRGKKQTHLVPLSSDLSRLSWFALNPARWLKLWSSFRDQGQGTEQPRKSDFQALYCWPRERFKRWEVRISGEGHFFWKRNNHLFLPSMLFSH